MFYWLCKAYGNSKGITTAVQILTITRNLRDFLKNIFEKLCIIKLFYSFEFCYEQEMIYTIVKILSVTEYTESRWIDGLVRIELYSHEGTALSFLLE